MAKILFRGIDKINPDPVLDRGCHKIGMPVCVLPPDYVWGSNAMMKAPDFIMLNITDLPDEKAKKFIEPETVNIGNEPVFYRICKYQINWATLPAAVKNTLITTGTYTATIAQVRPYLIVVSDSSQFVGFD